MKKISSDIDKFAVIILNWNGSKDTIECVRSVSEKNKKALIIIIDNGSTDDSFVEIKNAMLTDNELVITGTFDEVLRLQDNIKGSSVVLIEGKENLGFAGGCNLGLKIASAADIDICVFLNNDTVVEQNALLKVVNRLKSDSKLFVTLPLITIYDTDRIWNCGGTVSRLGFRSYNYANALLGSTKLAKEIPCTFFTGCCFAIRTKDFIARNGFSEKFFFGEEDFELSLWMKDHGFKALCITESVIQHKVSISFSQVAGTRENSKVFIYFLNRFIHMRLRFGKVIWVIWLSCYLPFIITMLFRKKTLNYITFLSFFKKLIRMANSKDSVTRKDFEYIMSSQRW